MSLEQSYGSLFAALQKIVDADPRNVPQLLAVILAGGPFRPFLEKPELLSKAVVMAKKYVAEKKITAAKAAAPGVVPQRGRARVMSLRDVAPRRGPSKA